MAFIRGPNGGPPIPVKVEPLDFHDTAQTFVDASDAISCSVTAAA
jgi:hypothetical protein